MTASWSQMASVPPAGRRVCPHAIAASLVEMDAQFLTAPSASASLQEAPTSPAAPMASLVAVIIRASSVTVDIYVSPAASQERRVALRASCRIMLPARTLVNAATTFALLAVTTTCPFVPPASLASVYANPSMVGADHAGMTGRLAAVNLGGPVMMGHTVRTEYVANRLPHPHLRGT